MTFSVAYFFPLHSVSGTKSPPVSPLPRPAALCAPAPSRLSLVLMVDLHGSFAYLLTAHRPTCFRGGRKDVATGTGTTEDGNELPWLPPPLECFPKTSEHSCCVIQPRGGCLPEGVEPTGVRGVGARRRCLCSRPGLQAKGPKLSGNPRNHMGGGGSPPPPGQPTT